MKVKGWKWRREQRRRARQRRLAHLGRKVRRVVAAVIKITRAQATQRWHNFVRRTPLEEQAPWMNWVNENPKPT